MFIVAENTGSVNIDFYMPAALDINYRDYIERNVSGYNNIPIALFIGIQVCIRLKKGKEKCILTYHWSFLYTSQNF